MAQNKVKFLIDKQGEITMEVIDGAGESCLAATADLEVSLASVGSKVDEGKKPEYYDGGGGISVFNDLQ